jgi:hypothetical protein
VEAKFHEMKSPEVIGKLAKELQGAGSFTGLESLNQQILRLLRNHNIYYRVHKSPPPVHILSHNPVHTLPTYFTERRDRVVDIPGSHA